MWMLDGSSQLELRDSAAFTRVGDGDRVGPRAGRWMPSVMARCSVSCLGRNQGRRSRSSLHAVLDRGPAPPRRHGAAPAAIGDDHVLYSAGRHQLTPWAWSVYDLVAVR